MKRVCADDSVPFAHAKVGHRQAIFKQKTPGSQECRGFLLTASWDRLSVASFPMFSRDGKRLVFTDNRNPAAPREQNVFVAD